MRLKSRLSLVVLLACFLVPNLAVPTAKADYCPYVIEDLQFCVWGLSNSFNNCIEAAANSGNPEAAGLCGESLANGVEDCIEYADSTRMRMSGNVARGPAWL